MSEFGAGSSEQGGRRGRRGNAAPAVATVAAAVITAAALATVVAARSGSGKAATAPATSLTVCVQRTGGRQSVGDLNVLTKRWCQKGQKPFKLALFGAGVRGPTGPAGPTGPPGPPGGPAASEYGVANVLVSRGGGHPTVWATYSTALGSPVGTTTGGAFRFSCSEAQAPCKVSIAAAVLSNSSGSAHVHAKVLISREAQTAQPNIFCEYADNADNSGAPAAVSLVPMSTHASAVNTLLSMGIGGSLDCKAGQPYTPSVKEIWVPGETPNKTSYYNVSSTFQFGG